MQSVLIAFIIVRRVSEKHPSLNVLIHSTHPIVLCKPVMYLIFYLPCRTNFTCVFSEAVKIPDVYLFHEQHWYHASLQLQATFVDYLVRSLIYCYIDNTGGLWFLWREILTTTYLWLCGNPQKCNVIWIVNLHGSKFMFGIAWNVTIMKCNHLDEMYIQVFTSMDQSMDPP